MAAASLLATSKTRLSSRERLSFLPGSESVLTHRKSGRGGRSPTLYTPDPSRTHRNAADRAALPNVLRLRHPSEDARASPLTGKEGQSGQCERPVPVHGRGSWPLNVAFPEELPDGLHREEQAVLVVRKALEAVLLVIHAGAIMQRIDDDGGRGNLPSGDRERPPQGIEEDGTLPATRR